MSLFIQEYILRFQIPVNNILVMQLFNAKQYFSHIKDTVLLTEEDLISHQSKELSVWQIVKHLCLRLTNRRQVANLFGIQGIQYREAHQFQPQTFVLNIDLISKDLG